MNISVILPVFNEAERLPTALETLSSSGFGSLEIIVADGGSTDETVELARRFTRKVVPCPKGRGVQMNSGAAISEGEILLFLHADSRIEDGGLHDLHSGMKQSGAVGGAFQLAIDSNRPYFKCISYLANVRTRLSGLPYGDQGIFVRRKIFEKLGGYQNIPLLEDLEFCRRLKKEGPLLLLSKSVWTSPRRWEQEGVLKVTVRNQVILGLYALGVSPNRMAGWYRTVR